MANYPFPKLSIQTAQQAADLRKRAKAGEKKAGLALVVLFTDGVSESMNVRQEEWGEERLIELAKTCHGQPALHAMRRILVAAQAFAEGAPQHDDMTLVVLRAA